MYSYYLYIHISEFNNEVNSSIYKKMGGKFFAYNIEIKGKRNIFKEKSGYLRTLSVLLRFFLQFYKILYS